MTTYFVPRITELLGQIGGHALATLIARALQQPFNIHTLIQRCDHEGRVTAGTWMEYVTTFGFAPTPDPRSAIAMNESVLIAAVPRFVYGLPVAAICSGLPPRQEAGLSAASLVRLL